MTKSSFPSKFRKFETILTNAVNRSVDLDYQHPKLYKKLIRYYADQGIEFYDDPTEDYELLLDCLVEDLNLVPQVEYA